MAESSKGSDNFSWRVVLLRLNFAGQTREYKVRSKTIKIQLDANQIVNEDKSSSRQESIFYCITKRQNMQQRGLEHGFTGI